MLALSYWNEYIQMIDKQEIFQKKHMLINLYTDMTRAANCAIKAYDANPYGIRLAIHYLYLA